VTVHRRRAIIDIGSNSVRLVVFDGPLRAPVVMFNEKVMAGLGRGVAATGAMDSASMDMALRAVSRFKALVVQMKCDSFRTVATAAVREATNAVDFLHRAAGMGLDIEVLSGDEEAAASGMGVLSADPDADGIVGDLGGGSLELIRICNGRVHQCVSFPFGALRLSAIRAEGPRALNRLIRQAVRKSSFKDVEKDLPFFLVGGSWRALGRLHMKMSNWPLPIAQAYEIPIAEPGRICQALDRPGPRKIKALDALSSARVPTLSDSAALLSVLVKTFSSSRLVVSAYGLREGLLFQALSPDERQEDPLFAAARALGEREGRFPEHGDLLSRWISGIFRDDNSVDARFRHVACLLADVGWLANPEYRAERGLQAALHGNWVGIDARGRAMVAQALHTSFGGSGVPLPLALLATTEDVDRAIRWGLAIRLGQRLSGGTALPLKRTALRVAGGKLELSFDADSSALMGESVERRLRQLGIAMQLPTLVEVAS
jgi:exopolyphosphatase / guanosine-5'-triphosphate,3'-diphosphate pyrophosphatase